MTHIRQLNADLRDFANGGISVPAMSSSAHLIHTRNSHINNPLIAYHRRIQRHARLLYSMLSEKLESPMCKCSGHDAHLELRMRNTPPKKMLSTPQTHNRDHGPNQFLTFSLVFLTRNNGFSSMWQEFQLEPVWSDGAGRQLLSPGHSAYILNAEGRLAALQIDAPAGKRRALESQSGVTEISHT